METRSKNECFFSAGGKNETRFFPLEAKRQNARAELKADMHRPTVIKQQQMVVVMMMVLVAGIMLVMMVVVVAVMMTMMRMMVVVLVMKNMMTCIVHMLASNSRWTWSRPPHNIRALRQDKLKIRDIKMATVKEQDKMFS